MDLFVHKKKSNMVNYNYVTFFTFVSDVLIIFFLFNKRLKTSHVHVINYRLPYSFFMFCYSIYIYNIQKIISIFLGYTIT